MTNMKDFRVQLPQQGSQMCEKF